MREQTDMPFLVRTDNGKFLRETDMVGGDAARDNLFYVYDEATGSVVPAPGTGGPPPPPGSMEPVHPHGTLELGEFSRLWKVVWTVERAQRAGRGHHGLRQRSKRAWRIIAGGRG